MMGKAGDFPNIPISHVLGCGCGADCDFLVRAETEEEILKVASEHATRHGIKEVTPELKNKMKSLIKSVWV